MKPVSLTLRGFIGIYKGMGLEEVSLDLSDLSGLIAFDAPNGTGKSTVLENLQPYRRLASRSGSLQHHVYLRDSYRDFTFELDGHTYRTLVKIDAQSGRQEGYVWKDGEPQVSGKATEYDKYIKNLLGSPDLFFQSVFAAQGGDSIADMTTGDLKKLFSEFLRLDKLAEYEETAKQAGNAVKEQIDEIRKRIDAADEKTAGLSKLREDLAAAEQNLSQKNLQIEEDQTAIRELEAEHERLKEAAAKHRAALEKDKELEKQKQDLEEKRGLAQSAVESAEKDYKDKIANLNSQIREKDQQLKNRGQHQALQSEANRLNMAIQDKERDLEACRKEVAAADEEIEGLRKAWDQYRNAAVEDIEAQNQHVAGLEQEHRQIEKKISEIDVEIKRLESNTETVQMQNRVAELQRTAEKLNQRDPECKSETCVFIVDAIEAQKQLPIAQDEYEKHVEKIRVRIAEDSNRRDNLDSELTDLKQTLRSARQRHADLQQELKDTQSRHEKELAELKKRRNNARADVVQIEESIRENKTRQEEIRQQLENMPNYEVLETEKKNLEAQAEETRKTWEERIAELKWREAELRDQIADIKNQQVNIETNYEAEEAAKEKAAEIETAKKNADRLRDSLSQLQSRIAVLQHQIKELNDLEEQTKKDKEKIEPLNAELSEWRYIQQACGKDGLRALEIDGTAPLIAGYANDLLTTTFGPGATVGFRTLDDEGRECLDVVVYREDDLDEKGTLLENLSGGQQVWVLKALRLALTLVSKEKSGKDISAAMADEEDGALDAESARSFIEMYRAFLDAGGFEMILYITHRDSCKAMADHVIRLTDRGIEVNERVARAA